MGHKEVGGIKAHIDDSGKLIFVLEQLEVDWKFSSDPVQTADNEIQARIIIREAFRENGLDVTFQAKPIHGVAGSGEHTHIGIGAVLKNGGYINLFNPDDMQKEFLSAVGYGSIMGILKHYEVINPFISATTDSLNRLKPGFEAPVCIVAALGGETPDVPTRNRSILAGLIRNAASPKATRIEMRAPNPFTNTYIALALFYPAAKRRRNFWRSFPRMSVMMRIILKRTELIVRKLMYLKISRKKNAMSCSARRRQRSGKTSRP